MPMLSAILFIALRGFRRTLALASPDWRAELISKQTPDALLDARSLQTSISSLSRGVKRMLDEAAEHIAAYADACRRGYDATALYDDLSRLSDAELARRGLTRADISRQVFQQLDLE